VGDDGTDIVVAPRQAAFDDDKNLQQFEEVVHEELAIVASQRNTIVDNLRSIHVTQEIVFERTTGIAMRIKKLRSCNIY